LSGHRNGVNNLKVLPNGTFLSWTGSADGELFLWSNAGQLIRHISGFKSYVDEVTIYQDNCFLVRGGDVNREVLFSPSGEPLEYNDRDHKKDTVYAPPVRSLADDPEDSTIRIGVSKSGDSGRQSYVSLLSKEGMRYVHLGKINSRNHQKQTSYDMATDISIMVMKERRVIAGVHVSRSVAIKLIHDDPDKPPIKKKIAPSQDLEIVARRIGTIRELQPTTGSATLYIVLRSEWAVNVLDALPRELTNNVRAVNITTNEALKAFGPLFPEYPMRLLQFSRMIDVEQVDLYGLSAEEVLFYACDELRQVEAHNCDIHRVFMEACPADASIRIRNLVTEPPEIVTLKRAD